VIPFPPSTTQEDASWSSCAGGALLLSIGIDHGSPRSVSSQLHSALRDLILAGSFGIGERLPASRTLAKDLKVSRTTVIEAFDRLTAEGLIESRVGAAPT
jgi:GntR family transcriptional regulator/MocR family aminotransferase